MIRVSIKVLFNRFEFKIFFFSSTSFQRRVSLLFYLSVARGGIFDGIIRVTVSISYEDKYYISRALNKDKGKCLSIRIPPSSLFLSLSLSLSIYIYIYIYTRRLA